MKPETVERLLQAVDELAQRIGEKNYDVTVEKIQRWAPIARFILDFFDIMQTREVAAKFLGRSEEPDPELIDFSIHLFHALPGILGSAMREAAKSDVLPPEPKGRHPIDPAKHREICVFVLDLHGKKGLSERVAKERPALHFNVSRRSVDRIWKNRVDALKDSEIAQQVFARFNEIVRGGSQPLKPSKKTSEVTS